MIKKIVFATDLGVLGPYVLCHALELSKQFGAKVDIIHVIEPMGIFAESILDIFLPPEDLDHLRKEGVYDVMKTIKERISDTMASEFAGDDDESFLGEINVVRGQPAEAILEYVDDHHIDMIVMGTHGEHGEVIGGLGSVASKVLQRSSVPVLMVPLARVNSQLGIANKDSLRRML
ncbi:MAG: universal stress protein [Oleispira antarctica]|uniref:UspA domain protein n=1 Tax=Oleispira antarctica RB-8 TaxID=698738 RepID=R4YSE3_OLEAN|nr:universal stress protein [Oleispira antarctica]MBQ0791497.1 universal stress protein [Oleispira antarctica]CCK76203.1 UspA domain protein [Oleispira antarctica RB-8]